MDVKWGSFRGQIGEGRGTGRRDDGDDVTLVRVSSLVKRQKHQSIDNKISPLKVAEDYDAFLEIAFS